MHAFSICVCIEEVGTQGRGKGEEGGGRERELGGGMCFFLPSYFSPSFSLSSKFSPFDEALGLLSREEGLSFYQVQPFRLGSSLLSREEGLSFYQIQPFR